LAVLDVFNVVEFKEGSEHQICVVPIEWLVGDGQCVWPPYRKQKQIDQAVRCRQQPEATWEVYDIRILGCAGILLLLHYCFYPHMLIGIVGIYHFLFVSFFVRKVFVMDISGVC